VNTVSPFIVASIESAKLASSFDLSKRFAPGDVTISSPRSTLTLVALARSVTLAAPGDSVTVMVVRGRTTNLPIGPRSIEAMPSRPVVMMLPLNTVAPGSAKIPFNDKVPVPPSTPAGDFAIEAAAGASTFVAFGSVLLAKEVSELKVNKLETASATTTLKTAFEFNFSIINPPRKSGRPDRVEDYRGLHQIMRN
jgi:hypothetical protein